jgi:hypothetical protein|tara:strand:+ start:3139 stop:3477 length:339 start_codon:yes stop_codon:yes gene_type:complete
MDLFHKLINLIDKNSDKIPEGDYLELCNTIQELRKQVKPPSFLLDQNDPMWMDDTLPSDPDTAAQRDREQFHQQWRENEDDVHPGLHQFIHELHEAWSEPVEPGDGTTSLSE